MFGNNYPQYPNNGFGQPVRNMSHIPQPNNPYNIPVGLPGQQPNCWPPNSMPGGHGNMDFQQYDPFPQPSRRPPLQQPNINPWSNKEAVKASQDDVVKFLKGLLDQKDLLWWTFTKVNYAISTTHYYVDEETKAVLFHHNSPRSFVYFCNGKTVELDTDDTILAALDTINEVDKDIHKGFMNIIYKAVQDRTRLMDKLKVLDPFDSPEDTDDFNDLNGTNEYTTHFDDDEEVEEGEKDNNDSNDKASLENHDDLGENNIT